MRTVEKKKKEEDIQEAERTGFGERRWKKTNAGPSESLKFATETWDGESYRL